MTDTTEAKEGSRRMSGEPTTAKTPVMESIYGIKSDAKLIGEMLAKIKPGDFTYVHTAIIQERVDSIFRYLAALESSYLDIEYEAAIKHFTSFSCKLQEYGIERDEKLVESARKFKEEGENEKGGRKRGAKKGGIS